MREDTKKAVLPPADASRSEYCRDARMNWAMTGIAILAFEIFIAIYAKGGFIRYYLGDVLAVAMLYAFGRAAFRLPPKALALAVFVLSLVIEIAQYFKVLEILGIQNSLLRIIFGGTFDWTDIACYAIGCALAYASESIIYDKARLWRRKRLPKNFNEILQSGDEEKIKAVFQALDINATDKDGNTILHMLHADKNIKEKDYLENTLLSIENCDDAKELREIREELIREGYIKSYKMPKKDNKPGTDMRKYISCEGNMIIVGKNNKQNDYLTLRLADNEDYWLHTKDIPGSHVLIKSAGKKVTDEELLEAGILAAYYSKARMSANVPVDYTMKKNVKKPSGAKPGMVIYEKNKTLYVTPSDEAKAKIKKA